MRVLWLVVVTILSCRPAYACSCSIDLDADRAELVFTATIYREIVVERCLHRSGPCSNTYTYVVTVDGVFKGSLDKMVVLKSGTGSGDCSRGALGQRVEGTRWLFLIHDLKARFSIRSCSGTQRLTPEALGAMTRKFGRPRKPAT